MLFLCVAHNMNHEPWSKINFAQSARKHRVGISSAIFVIQTNEYQIIQNHDPLKLAWIGVDVRGRELEIIAVQEGTEILVIHVMPTIYRRGKKNG